jgi:hypothetical protein
MREIKFRAWDSINNEMIYQSDAKSYINKGISNYDILKKYEIVMQFTGINDVYEGDVVLIGSMHFYVKEEGFNGVVKFLEGRWVVDNGKELISLWSDVYYPIVIGNIYENK